MASNTGANSPGELEITPSIVEQLRILDGDDGLGGEALEQRHLFAIERDRLAVRSSIAPTVFPLRIIGAIIIEL